MDIRCGFALLMQVSLNSVEQACADTLALSCGLDVEPVELHFGGAWDGVIADAADHTVMLVDCQQNISPVSM